MKGRILVSLVGLATAVIGDILPLVRPEDVAGDIAAGGTKRSPGDITHVYVCTGPFWTEICQNLEVRKGPYGSNFCDNCLNLGYPFQDSISSLGPDEGTQCNFFKDINCFKDDLSNRGFSTKHPGVENLGAVLVGSTNFDNIISSYCCFDPRDPS